MSLGGRDRHPKLNDYLLRADARLQARVGGAMQSLNVRITRDLLSRFDGRVISRREAQNTYSELQAGIEPFRYPKREQRTDGEVLKFLEQATASGACKSKSTALKLFRSSGQACEQSRFARLFDQVTGTRQTNDQIRDRPQAE